MLATLRTPFRAAQFQAYRLGRSFSTQRLQARSAPATALLRTHKVGGLQIPFAGPAVRASQTVRNYSAPIGKIDKPTYQLTFTCKACNHRSSHFVSKQAYHGGTVLIQCPSCTNRHLIADYLNVFGQGKKTLEDILNEKGDGETVQKKTVDLNKLGDIEWEGPGQLPEQVEIKKD